MICDCCTSVGEKGFGIVQFDKFLAGAEVVGREAEGDEELSIGDYVLSGGELAAMVVLDAVIRQLPGALGHKDSAQEDSYANGLLDCPHYTRPETYEGVGIPEVLMSGNHEAIRRWRLQQALGRKYERRPDLLEGRVMTPPSSTNSLLMSLNKVVFPAPLRPIRPTLWPVGIVAEASRNSGRPSTA